MAVVLPTTKQEWLDLRKSFVGASEVAAIFDAHPYISHYELWHEKSGLYKKPNLEEERIFWGNQLEDSIANGIASLKGLSIKKRGFESLQYHPSIKGFASTLDFEIEAMEGLEGPGVFEIKNVDWLSFKSKYLLEGDNVQAPLYVEIQLQAQMAVTGYQWGLCGILVGGNTAYLIPRKRSEKAIKQIEQAITHFWGTVEKGQKPNPSKENDYKITLEAYEPVDESVTPLEDSINPKLAEYLKANATQTELTKLKGVLKAEILERLGNYENGFTDQFWVSNKADKNGLRKMKITERTLTNG